jgi:hypothetical protein
MATHPESWRPPDAHAPTPGSLRAAGCQRPAPARPGRCLPLVWAPAATPAEVQQKLNAAITQALQDPGLAGKLREQGGEPAPMTIPQFRDFIQAESAQIGRIVEAGRITAD